MTEEQRTTPSGSGEPQKQFINGKFIPIPTNVMNMLREHDDLKPIDIIVYIALLYHGGKDGRCWASNGTVAEEIGVCTKTVERSLKRLGKHGIIVRPRRHQSGSLFTILLIRVDKNGVIKQNAESGPNGKPPPQTGPGNASSKPPGGPSKRKPADETDLSVPPAPPHRKLRKASSDDGEEQASDSTELLITPEWVDEWNEKQKRPEDFEEDVAF